MPGDEGVGRFRGRFFQWTPDGEPAVIVATVEDDAWDELRAPYESRPGAPDRRNAQLDRVIEIARGHRTATVVVERRYIDADYRSEHARFYSGTYRRYPSVSHRLHFFTGRFSDLRAIPDHADTYKGYAVMRPLERSPVGRTMIAPPPDMADDVVCLAPETVSLFGWDLEVHGVPFVSQDEQFLRCAHAVQWVVLRHAHLRHGSPRRLPVDIHDASTGGLVVGRQSPSAGLSLAQMLDGLGNLGLSPTLVDLPDSREASEEDRELSLFAIVCRYVNSELPPIVVSQDHARVVVGYRSAAPYPQHDGMMLYVHDDARGPYLPVANPWGKGHQWKLAVPPLPPKFHLTAEKAEEIGRQWYRRLCNASGTADGAPQEFADAVDGGRIHYRTYAVLARDFKRDLGTRRIGQEIEHLYRFTQWPRYLWVVEAHDTELMPRQNESVVGEIIIDPTSHQFSDMHDAGILAVHVCGTANTRTPDHETGRRAVWPGYKPYLTGCPPFQRLQRDEAAPASRTRGGQGVDQPAGKA